MNVFSKAVKKSKYIKYVRVNKNRNIKKKSIMKNKSGLPSIIEIYLARCCMC